MSKLLLDCSRGAAGDMIVAALFSLQSDKSAMLHRLNHMGLPGVSFQPETRDRYGVHGSAMRVLVHGMEEEELLESSGDVMRHLRDAIHPHMTMNDVQTIVEALQVSESVRASVMSVYQLIAAAESEAHQCTVEEVHFHEVGALDAIADVTAACLLMETLHPEEVLAVPVQVGCGTVRCAHGILPVPAPATAAILRDIPYAKNYQDGELCTPTGAALIRHFTDRYIQFDADWNPGAMQSGRISSSESETNPVSFADVLRRFSVMDRGIGIGGRTFEKPSYFAAYKIGGTR